MLTSSWIPKENCPFLQACLTSLNTWLYSKFSPVHFIIIEWFYSYSKNSLRKTSSKFIAAFSKFPSLLNSIKLFCLLLDDVWWRSRVESVQKCLDISGERMQRLRGRGEWIQPHQQQTLASITCIPAWGASTYSTHALWKCLSVKDRSYLFTLCRKMCRILYSVLISGIFFLFTCNASVPRPEFKTGSNKTVL